MDKNLHARRMVRSGAFHAMPAVPRSWPRLLMTATGMTIAAALLFMGLAMALVGPSVFFG